MADDALAKAAEAVREWMHQHYCTRCTLSSKDCESWCKIYPLRSGFAAESLARAVLEAAGVAGGEEPESRDAMVHDMVMQSLLEEHRRKAALQRAGRRCEQWP